MTERRRGTSLYLKGEDPRYRRSVEELENEWAPISTIGGRVLKMGMRSAFIGYEVKQPKPHSFTPNVINMPDRRLGGFAGKMPAILFGVRDRLTLLEAVAEGDVMRVLKQLDRGVPATTKDATAVPALH
jgi:hypothetical protein